MGYTISEFDDMVVFDGFGATENPTGRSIYGVIDFGKDFYFDQNLYVAPFVGFGMTIDEILHQSDSAVFGRAGGHIGYKTDAIMGMFYDYKLFASAFSDSTYVAGIKMDFVSTADKASGGFAYTVMSDEFGISHKLSLEFKFEF